MGGRRGRLGSDFGGSGGPMGFWGHTEIWGHFLLGGSGGPRGGFGVTPMGVPRGLWGHDEIWGQISGGGLGVPWGGGGGGWGQILGEEGLGVPGGFLGSH